MAIGPHSRYRDVPDRELERNGRTIVFKAIRSIPPTGPVEGHEVAAGERVDLLADRYFGDVEQYWRIADNNPVLNPEELTADPGRAIQIPRER